MVHNQAIRAPDSSSRRFQFIDFLRGCAVIAMLEAHTFNPTLRPDIISSDLFQVLRYLNGLIAPTFLFTSGMVFAVSTHRRIGEYTSFGGALAHRFGRLLLILFFGYLLHIPRFEYYHLRYVAGQEAWRVFFQADVLQCIAVSLLILQILLLLLRDEKRLYAIVAPLTLLILVLTPVVWSIDFWTIFPPSIAAYMNGLHYSLFPLFPWTGFMYAGALSGYLYINARDQKGNAGQDRMIKRIALVGGGLILVSFPLEVLEPLVYPVYDYWKTGPSFVFLRIGIVAILLLSAYMLEKQGMVNRFSVITLFGRRSLLIYVVHLMVLYGKYGSFVFVDWVGRSFSFVQAVPAALALILLMYALAWVWDRIDKAPTRIRLGFRLAVLSGFLLSFFMRGG